MFVVHPGVRAFHWVARGYAIRRHVMRVLSAAVSMQRCARKFLLKNRVFKSRVFAAVKMQAAWRGFVFRIMNEDMMDVSEAPPLWRWLSCPKALGPFAQRSVSLPASCSYIR